MSDKRSRSEKIAALNDALRKDLFGGFGRVVCTSGVNAKGATFVTRALTAVMAFDTFTGDNDPHGEHDFGAFDLDDERLFWKIDYYDLAMQFGSEDPADPKNTLRVLTVMLSRGVLKWRKLI